MASIEKVGAPDIHTVGSVGDICTDTATGNKYKCTAVITSTAYKETEKSYSWELVKSEGGSSVVSPTISISEIDGGHSVTITDVNGSQSFDVMDGADGAKGDKGDTGEQGPEGPQGEKGDKGDKGDTGASGTTPVRGTDYWTEEDKAEIVQEVKDAIAAEA